MARHTAAPTLQICNLFVMLLPFKVLPNVYAENCIVGCPPCFHVYPVLHPAVSICRKHLTMSQPYLKRLSFTSHTQCVLPLICIYLLWADLDGAMSSFRLGTQGSPQRTSADNSTLSADNPNTSEDYHYFLLNEIARHNEQAAARKRSSGGDQLIESPSRKRSRLM